MTEVLHNVLPLGMRIRGLRNDAAAVIGPLPLERIQAPTLIISTKDDLFQTLAAAEHLAEHIPAAKLVVLDSGGHLLVGRQAEVGSVDARVRAALIDPDQHPRNRTPLACIDRHQGFRGSAQ